MTRPTKNDTAIQLRTFGSDIVGMALLIRNATPGINLDEADSLDDLADRAMGLARQFAGSSEQVEADAAEILLRFADQAQMIGSGIRDPVISEATRTSVESLRNFVLRYPLLQTGDGARFRSQ
jgi:hypothetical protein